MAIPSVSFVLLILFTFLQKYLGRVDWLDLYWNKNKIPQNHKA